MQLPKHITAAVLAFLLITQLAQADDSPAATLDALQEAGADRDQDTILQLITEDGSLLGFASGSSRWGAPTLPDDLKRYFSRGGSWPRFAGSRQITLSPQGDTAWFSALSEGEGGTGLASGVLVSTDSGWQLAQYHIHYFGSLEAPNYTAHSETSDDSDSKPALGAIEPNTAGNPVKKRCKKMRHKTNRSSSC